MSKGEKPDAHVARESAAEALVRARGAREAAEAAELAAVDAARGAGLSWGRIGEVYGLTKQGAQQRFKHSLAQRSVP